MNESERLFPEATGSGVSFDAQQFQHSACDVAARYYSQHWYGATFRRGRGRPGHRRSAAATHAGLTAGSVLNEKTIRSQAIGGGAALHEAVTLDPRVNHDLAEYHVPVHADIPASTSSFLPNSTTVQSVEKELAN